jgi:hypothetical protein
MSWKILLPALLSSTFAMIGRAAEENPKADYVKVEIRGTLETGVVAIGGETTGIVIRSAGSVWELDLGGDAELIKRAEQLDKQTVVVTGLYRKQQGVEVPVRHIIAVAKLEAAK